MIALHLGEKPRFKDGDLRWEMTLVPARLQSRFHNRGSFLLAQEAISKPSLKAHLLCRH